jgi:hypothetical protein
MSDDEWAPRGNPEDDVNDFLEGGGIPSAAFDNIGDSWEGTIVRLEKQQGRDLETKELQTWDDGSPKYIILIDIQTNVRNPDIPGDDGVRRLWVRGNMLTAIRSAMRVTQSKLRTGGHLKVSYVRQGELKTRGHTPPKLSAAETTPSERPVSALSADDLA